MILSCTTFLFNDVTIQVRFMGAIKALVMTQARARNYAQACKQTYAFRFIWRIQMHKTCLRTRVFIDYGPFLLGRGAKAWKYFIIFRKCERKAKREWKRGRKSVHCLMLINAEQNRKRARSFQRDREVQCREKGGLYCFKNGIQKGCLKWKCGYQIRIFRKIRFQRDQSQAICKRK